MLKVPPDETTVTRKSQLAPSELLIVTGVVPNGKKEPDAGVEEIVPHVPDVVASKLTFAPATVSPLKSVPVVSAVTVMFPGHVKAHVGGLLLDEPTSIVELLLAVRGSRVALWIVALLPSLRSAPFGRLLLMW
jgi:hypothetical protein